MHGHQQGGSGGGGNGEGIETDILPESAFPSVAWLRQYGMHMFRWAGDSNEWTEYAMHLPPNIASAMFGTDYANPGPQGSPSLTELQSASGCKMWLDKETLMGREEPFLVFLRGPAGQSSNTCMNVALELVSNKMKLLLQPSMGQGIGTSSSSSSSSSLLIFLPIILDLDTFLTHFCLFLVSLSCIMSKVVCHHHQHNVKHLHHSEP